MRKMCGFLVTVAAVVLLLPMMAFGEGIPLPDGITEYFGADGIETECTLQVESLLPFTETAIAPMNRLLSHIKLKVAIDSQQKTNLTVAVGETAVAEFCEENGMLTTTLLPNRVLQGEDALQALLGQDDAVWDDFNLFAAVEEVSACYDTLREAICTLAEGKKANYNIKGVGGGKWSHVAKLNKAQAEEITPLLLPVLVCGLPEEDRAVLAGASLKSSFTVALYRTAQDGADIALYAKGNVLLADGSTKALSYQWAFAEKDGKRVDTYKLELGKGRNGGFAVTADITRQNAGGYGLSGSMQTQRYRKEDDYKSTVTYELSGKESGGLKTLSGTVTLVKNGQTTTCTADLRLQETALSGSLSVEEKASKQVLNKLKVLFSKDATAQPPQSTSLGNGIEITIIDNDTISAPEVEAAIDIPADTVSVQIDADALSPYRVGQPPVTLQELKTPAAEQHIRLDAADEKQQQALWAEMTQRLAGRLLRAFGQLPAEDTAFLQQGLSAETIPAFLQMLRVQPE